MECKISDFPNIACLSPVPPHPFQFSCSLPVPPPPFYAYPFPSSPPIIRLRLCLYIGQLSKYSPPTLSSIFDFLPCTLSPTPLNMLSVFPESDLINSASLSLTQPYYLRTPFQTCFFFSGAVRSLSFFYLLKFVPRILNGFPLFSQGR